MKEILYYSFENDFIAFKFVLLVTYLFLINFRILVVLAIPTRYQYIQEARRCPTIQTSLRDICTVLPKKYH